MANPASVKTFLQVCIELKLLSHKVNNFRFKKMDINVLQHFLQSTICLDRS